VLWARSRVLLPCYEEAAREAAWQLEQQQHTERWDYSAPATTSTSAHPVVRAARAANASAPATKVGNETRSRAQHFPRAQPLARVG
jgi:hypothetical protein